MRKTRTTNRKLLKTTASVVLASRKASTYSEYASAFRSLRPCWTATLNILVRKMLYPKWLKSISLDTDCRAYGLWPIADGRN